MAWPEPAGVVYATGEAEHHACRLWAAAEAEPDEQGRTVWNLYVVERKPRDADAKQGPAGETR